LTTRSHTDQHCSTSSVQVATVPVPRPRGLCRAATGV